MKARIIKVKNIGSRDPFNARLMIGVMNLRDAVITSEEDRRLFDKLYEPVLENLEDSQQAKDEMEKIINEHEQKIKSKEIVSFQHGNDILEISESIDKDLNRLFKEFFIKGEIALKSLQHLTKQFGIDIGFFFAKDEKFSAGIDNLKISPLKGGKEIARMLSDDRKWHTAFNEIRSRIEHQGLKLPEIKYIHDGSTVKTLIPTINSKRVDDVIRLMFTNLFEFTEDMIAHLVAERLIDPLRIISLQERQRDPIMPIKYVIGIV